MDPIFLVIEPDFPRAATRYELTVGDRRAVRLETRWMEVSSGIPRSVIVRRLVDQMAADYRGEIEKQLRRVGAL